ncbi:GerAB/ArcD/ProY family transporter [Bacillus aerolatus]|uniref:GerAB/ArcD/ProY family transporter n=1 Tax=Bacillus aerolatus TaxID=2653354 RepID=A0A6I1FEH4_9BACI|nr:endospore germination permease [Bacillus aerolatus]KAB7706206.1 GerAB/ArcD/ProY family transporter [Bacillus aerolatus]
MEKGKISSLQMAMLMYPTIVATAILSVPGITATYAKQDLWLSPILASLIGFVTVYIAYKLHKLYPEQTVIQFSEQILGQFAGKVLGFLFLFFYIQTTGHMIRAYSEFIVGSFLFKTPISAIIVSMTLLCAFAVHGGLEVVGRVAQLFFPVFVIPIILLILLLIPDFEIGNILPILERGIMPPIKGAIVLSGWFAEFFLIIFLFPFLSDRRKGMKYGMITVVVAMMTLVVVNLVVFFVLGITTASQNYPLMNVSRYISYADFFENLESIVMAVWIIGAFVKASLFYYVTVLGTAQWLNLSDYRPIIWPIGILIVQFSFWSLPSTMALARFDFEAFPLWGLLTQTLIPLFLLLIAVARKRKQTGSKTS